MTSVNQSEPHTPTHTSAGEISVSFIHLPKRALLAASALAVCGAIGLTASAGAASGAKTTVTIEAAGVDLSGFVSSRKPECASERKVRVFRQLGRTQDPQTDAKLATDTSSDTPSSGDGYQWSTGNTGTAGKFYARVGKIPGCKPALSDTVRARR